MFSKIAVALATVSLVSAQTSTECNPLKTTCKPDPAFGKKGADCDFTAGACDGFHAMAGKAVTYDSRGAIAAMGAPGQSPTLRSDNYLFFGRVDVEMQAAAGKGIVTSIVLLSDDLDEVDFETVGFDNKQIQSNYFSKGDDSVFDRGGFHDVDNPLGAGNRPGTLTWVGGVADFSNGDSTAIYKSIKVVDYAGGSSATDKDVKEYVYGDKSGSAKSIKINLKDGSSITAGEGGSSSSSSSSSSASSAASSASSSKTSSAVSESSSTTSAVSSDSTTVTAAETSSTMNSTSSVTAATSSTANETNATSTLATSTASRTSASSTSPASGTPTSGTPTSGASSVGAVFGAAALILAALAI
ncbi:hypothetical protein LLEC1_07385 [Akanthomyces lecanii]|uniref:GH16 domain-containing protein n=1 Tax=Cordyceps confragosa TaxID=2714763 RepID=A0A179I102_CORDF|nr:hypothetical protein LLEC1_07385 [Akanthomyces lecanii]